MPVHVTRLAGKPPFEDDRAGWWGYRVSIEDRAPFDYWVLGADTLDLGDGFVQREAVAERLGDGSDPFDCDDPHIDDYYDETWTLVIEDLRQVGHLV